MKRKIQTVLLIIGLIILFLIVFFLVKSTVRYIKLKSEGKKTLENNMKIEIKDDVSLDLVGLLDSYGVPYSPNVENSFFYYLETDLDSRNMLGETVDLFNLYINKTWEVNGIINNRITFEEMTDLKNFSLDFTRYKYTDSVVKNNLKYNCDEDKKDVVIADYISSLENPCVIYSCSANDLFYYYGVSFESLTIKKGIELINNFDNGLDSLQEGIISNIETIIDINPKSQIFIMGLYLPSDNYFIQAVASGIINKVNKMICKICEQYENCYYVDVSCVSNYVLDGDFHPNSDGQKVIANKLAQSISKNFKANVLSTGLKGKTVERSKLNYYSGELNAIDIMQDIDRENLLRSNYVEWTVALERSLNNLYPNGVTYHQLKNVKDEMVEMCDKNDKDALSHAIDVVVAEYKIFYQIDESQHSLHPETKKNDKLGLISYYKTEE